MNSKTTAITFGKVLVIGSCITFFASCGGDSGEGTETLDTARTNLVKNNTQKVFTTVPSPIEMATLLQKAGAKYDKSILNDIENASKYSSTASKALNLGVYGADLTYTSVFDQTNESMFFLTASKKLADGLGVSEAFKKETLDRMQNNVNDKDSMMAIISNSFGDIDSYLQENDRANVSALVIAGGWVEGLYLACKIAKIASNPADIKTRLAEQKLSLNSLLAILNAYSADAAVTDVAKDLTALKEVYTNVTVNTSNSTVTANESGTFSIGADADKPTLSDEQFEKISAKIIEIRNKIVN